MKDSVVRSLVSLPRLVHWTLVIAVGISLSVPSPFGFIRLRPEILGPLLVQISGAMIALSWPAAQLASQWIEKANGLFARALNYDDHPDLGEIRSNFENLRNSLAPAKRGIWFAVLSFFTAILGLILSMQDLSILSLEISANDIATGLSVSALGFSIILFLPTALYAFRLEAVESAINAVEVLRNQSSSEPRSRDPENGVPVDEEGGQ